MILSILIPTIQGREESYERLVKELLRQEPKGEFAFQVEMITIKDNKEISIGAKRQKLLEAAKGKYIVFIDDDDFIGPTYLEDILNATKSNPDCIGFLQNCTFDDGPEKICCLSLKYREWKDNVDGFFAVRSPYHKTPMLRSKAILAGGFKDLRYAEDHDFSKRVTPLLLREEFINKQLYFYRYKSEEFNFKYGIKG
jgi:glycosyltransferase involved in cell wall biosynthesis